MLRFVSSGLLRPKKDDTHVNRLNRYFNYGLLGLATLAATSRSDVMHLNPVFEDPALFADQLGEAEEEPLILSLPSVYALDWAECFIREYRFLNPRSRIICGGRWVVDGRADWVKRRIGCDIAVSGFGEPYLSRMLGLQPVDADQIGLDYSLVSHLTDFQPSVEVARGCGRGCRFCVEAHAPRSAPKSPSGVARELKNLLQIYMRHGVDKHTDIRPFLQDSLFNPSLVWANELGDLLSRNGLGIGWRAQSRVDTLSRSRLLALGRAGLRVLDLGLESASPQQLLSMRKTKSPDKYLQRASQVLEWSAEAGISIKLNIVLYPGETPATLAQTHAWLEQHSSAFAGISANPMILYDLGPSRFPGDLAALGARPVDAAQFSRSGYHDLHLSPGLDNLKARRLCLELSREFMRMESYYELKKYSYFSPLLTYGQFVQAVQSDDPSELPFVPGA